jgi:hypothetical protein
MHAGEICQRGDPVMPEAKPPVLTILEAAKRMAQTQ